MGIFSTVTIKAIQNTREWPVAAKIMADTRDITVGPSSHVFIDPYCTKTVARMLKKVKNILVQYNLKVKLCIRF